MVTCRAGSLRVWLSFTFLHTPRRMRLLKSHNFLVVAVFIFRFWWQPPRSRLKCLKSDKLCLLLQRLARPTQGTPTDHEVMRSQHHEDEVLTLSGYDIMRSRHPVMTSSGHDVTRSQRHQVTTSSGHNVIRSRHHKVMTSSGHDVIRSWRHQVTTS